MPTTKFVAVPGGLAVVFHVAGEKLEESRVTLKGALPCMANGTEGHEIDFEPGTDDYLMIAMEGRQHAGHTEAVVFDHGDGRSNPATKEDTVKAVNAKLEPQKPGLMSRIARCCLG